MGILAKATQIVDSFRYTHKLSKVAFAINETLEQTDIATADAYTVKELPKWVTGRFTQFRSLKLIIINSLYFSSMTQAKLIKILSHELAHANWYYFDTWGGIWYWWVQIGIQNKFKSPKIDDANQALNYTKFFNEWITEIYWEKIFEILKQNKALGIPSNEAYSSDDTSANHYIAKEMINGMLRSKKDIPLLEAQEKVINYYKSGDIQWFFDYIFDGFVGSDKEKEKTLNLINTTFRL